MLARFVPTILTATLTAMVPCQASYAAKTLPSPDQPTKPDVVFVALPIAYEPSEIDNSDGKCAIIPPPSPYEDQLKGLTVHRISIDKYGTIFWNGAEFATANLDKLLKTELVADGITELQFYPSENAPAGVAINTLKGVIGTGFPCFGFVGNEQYRKMWRSKTPDTAPWDLSSIDLSPPPERRKAVPPVAIQVISTDSESRTFHDAGFAGVSSTGRCRAFAGGKAVSSDELYDLGKDAMWAAINKAGGQEKFQKGERGPEDVPDAIILTTPNTPWRCVGGVVFNLQVSGFLEIGFALRPDSQ